MNISGIRIQAGFYDYNTIKNTQIQEETVPNTIDEVAKDTRVAEVTERERDTNRIMVPQSMRNSISRMPNMS